MVQKGAMLIPGEAGQMRHFVARGNVSQGAVSQIDISLQRGFSCRLSLVDG